MAFTRLFWNGVVGLYLLLTLNKAEESFGLCWFNLEQSIKQPLTQYVGGGSVGCLQ